MEKRIINPWTWQDQYGYVQANQVTGHSQVLWCAGQTSVDDDGNPLHEGDMGAQALQCVDNLETVVAARRLCAELVDACGASPARVGGTARTSRLCGA